MLPKISNLGLNVNFNILKAQWFLCQELMILIELLLQYSINDRITEDLDKSIFTIQNNLQNYVTIMITIYRKKDSRIYYSSFLS